MRQFYTRKRIVKMYSGGPPSHTNEWRHLCKLYGSICLACKVPVEIDLLTRDHIIPVGKPGSRNQVENLQPLCSACNMKKDRRIIDFRKDKSSLMPQIIKEWEKKKKMPKDKSKLGITMLEQANKEKKEKEREKTLLKNVSKANPKQDEISRLMAENRRLGKQICALNLRLLNRKKECHLLRNTPLRNAIFIKQGRKKRACMWVKVK